MSVYHVCGCPCLQHHIMHYVLSFKVDGVSKPIATLEDCTTIVWFVLFVVLEENTLHPWTFALQGCGWVAYQLQC